MRLDGGLFVQIIVGRLFKRENDLLLIGCGTGHSGEVAGIAARGVVRRGEECATVVMLLLVSRWRYPG